MALKGTLTVVFTICHFQVKEEMLFEALTTRKTVTVGEKLIVPYKLSEVTLYLHLKYRWKKRHTRHVF